MIKQLVSKGSTIGIFAFFEFLLSHAVLFFFIHFFFLPLSQSPDGSTSNFCVISGKNEEIEIRFLENTVVSPDTKYAKNRNLRSHSLIHLRHSSPEIHEPSVLICRLPQFTCALLVFDITRASTFQRMIDRYALRFLSFFFAE